MTNTDPYVDHTASITHALQTRDTDAEGVMRCMTLEKCADQTHTLHIATKWPDDLEEFVTVLHLTPAGLEMLSELLAYSDQIDAFPVPTLETLKETV